MSKDLLIFLINIGVFLFVTIFWILTVPTSKVTIKRKIVMFIGLIAWGVVWFSFAPKLWSIVLS